MSKRVSDDLYYIENTSPDEAAPDGSSYYTDPAAFSGKKRSGSRKKINFRSLAGILAGVAAGAIICAVFFTVMTVKSNATAMNMDYETKLKMILSYLDMYYLNDLDDQMIEDAVAKGLMDNIGDKYAQYYTQEEFSELLGDMQGEYSGIGVQIVMNDDGMVEVYVVYDESPAKEAGIQAKDLIVEAQGQRDFETLDDLVALVRGPEGTFVDIVISRAGEEIPLTIERRSIQIVSVYGEMISDTAGYLQIAEFNTAAAQQFREILDGLFEQGMESLIIDLRNNPGGDYDSVVDMCDRVLPAGVIVSTEDKVGGMVTENSDDECIDIPVVLLVNENTASAAELFTMALHDYGMAQIVGTTTYGKGVVQSIFMLPDGSGLKFTTEKYYGPNGDYIQDSGIEPDFEVEIPEEAYEDGVITIDEDLQLQKAAQILDIDLNEWQEKQEQELMESESQEQAE